MRTNLPPIDRADTNTLRMLSDELTRALIPAVSQNEAAPFIHLRDNAGGVWRVDITTAGVLRTTSVIGVPAP